MKQIFVLIALLLLHIGLFAAEDCNASKISVTPDMLSEEEKEYLLQKHEIKMCVDPDWMPFEHVNRMGKYEGILADYTQLFSKKLGIPFVLQKTENYRQSREYLNTGKCDIIVGEQATENVKKLYFTTKPYFETPRAFVTGTDALLVHDFSQIAWSGKIGVLPDSPAEVLLPPDLSQHPAGDSAKYRQRVAAGSFG